MPLDGGGAASKSGAASISVLSLYNPERRAAVNVVPGLIGVILTMTMIMFTAMAIVRERERGNLELLITTPVSSAELMIGKVLPYIGVGLVQTTVVLLLGVLVFDVPIRGALPSVYGAAMLLIVANLSLGLLVSTRAQTQFQAMQMAFFLFLPSILLSGFMFPFDGMPIAAQWIAEILPLTHFVRLIRGVMLRRRPAHLVAGRTGAGRLHPGDDEPGDRAVPQAVGLSAARDCSIVCARSGPAECAQHFLFGLGR
jgi:ABC-2 type transport system permease protein